MPGQVKKMGILTGDIPGGIIYSLRTIDSTSETTMTRQRLVVYFFGVLNRAV
jgi:hypothetical protein